MSEEYEDEPDVLKALRESGWDNVVKDENFISAIDSFSVDEKSKKIIFRFFRAIWERGYIHGWNTKSDSEGEWWKYE